MTDRVFLLSLKIPAIFYFFYIFFFVETKIYLIPRIALETLVREFIAYPYMEFQKSTDINMDIHDFWMLVFSYPYKCEYPH